MEKITLLIEWYDVQVRPFLELHDKEKLAAIEKEKARLQQAIKLCDEPFTVCLLGNSGIGKSTLINALLDCPSHVVPSGGIGPLTAQAIEVRYGLTPQMEVSYHGIGPVDQTIFGLRQTHRMELADVSDDRFPEPEDYQSVSADVRTHIENELGEEDKRQEAETLTGRAKLMVKGHQSAEVEVRYLLDTLQESIGRERVFGTRLEPEDEARLRDLQSSIQRGRTQGRFKLRADEDPVAFQARLKVHASGHLAPLIKTIAVSWNAELLRDGVTLVDLPGVGIAKDAHRKITRDYIRNHAKALIVVVDHRGMTESLLEALNRSEFLNALLHAGDSPEEEPVLLVAITRVDDAADEEFRGQIARARRRAQIFVDISQEAKEVIRRAIGQALSSLWLNATDVTEYRREVADNLVRNLKVHPVSAPQFQKILAGDEDDAPFLRDTELTGIPPLQRSIREIAVARRNRQIEQAFEAAVVFRDRVAATIRLMQAEWEQEVRIDEQLQQLREDLSCFFQPLREQLANRRGDYRNYLRETIPAKIEGSVQEAQRMAERAIGAYLSKIGTAHWSTLRASVRKFGRFSGATHIDLPNEFALRFEAPLAELWTGKILRAIRRKTTEFANGCEDIVEQAAERIREEGNRVHPRTLEARREAIRVDAQRLKNVGKDSIDDVRKEARSQLIEVLETHIKRRCQKFVEDNLHVGPGVRARILELYDELAEQVVDAASAPATRTLTKLYKDAEVEILDAFQQSHDPLDSLLDAVIRSTERRLEQTSSENRSLWVTKSIELLDQAPILESAVATA